MPLGFSVEHRCPECDRIEYHRVSPGLPATHYDPPEPAQVECEGCGAVDAVDPADLRSEYEYQRVMG